jgi:hypothetical protein
MRRHNVILTTLLGLVAVTSIGVAALVSRLRKGLHKSGKGSSSVSCGEDARRPSWC